MTEKEWKDELVERCDSIVDARYTMQIAGLSNSTGESTVKLIDDPTDGTGYDHVVKGYWCYCPLLDGPSTIEIETIDEIVGIRRLPISVWMRDGDTLSVNWGLSVRKSGKVIAIGL